MPTKQEIFDLHKQHPEWCAREMADFFGCPPVNVHVGARRAGLLLPRARICRTRVAQHRDCDYVPGTSFLWRNFPFHVEAALQAGRSVEQIARQFGVNLEIVERTARELLPVPTHSESARRSRERSHVDV